jgi:hypothetical protein
MSATGLLVTLDGVDVTCHAYPPLVVTRGREHPGESFEPSRCTLSFDDVPMAKRGQVVEVQLNAPDSDPPWSAAVGAWTAQTKTWAETRVRIKLFRGRITDTSTSWVPLVPHVSWDVVTDVVAVDAAAELSSVMVGAAAYPQESVSARAARIQADALAQGFATTWTNDPSTTVVAARDAQRASALELLDDLAHTASLAGGVWHDANLGKMLFVLGGSRQSSVPSYELDSCQMYADVAVVESASDIANDVTVGWVNAGNDDAVVITDPASWTANGRRSKSVQTDLVSISDATARGNAESTRYGRALRRFMDIRLSSTIITNKPEAEALLTLPPGIRVRLSGLPAPAPTGWDGYTEGWSIEVDADAWLVTLELSPAGWTGPLLAWSAATHTPSANWQDVQPGYSWLDATDYLLWIV